MEAYFDFGKMNYPRLKAWVSRDKIITRPLHPTAKAIGFRAQGGVWACSRNPKFLGMLRTSRGSDASDKTKEGRPPWVCQINLRGQLSVEFLILLCAFLGVLLIFLGPIGSASDLSKAQLSSKRAEFGMQKIESTIFELALMGDGSRIEFAPNLPDGKLVFFGNSVILEYFLGKNQKKIEMKIALYAKYAEFKLRKGLKIEFTRDTLGVLATEKS